MSDAIEGYILDSLQELTVISEKKGCKITVVKDTFDGTLFVKKQFDTNSNIDIYKSLMEVEHSALPKIYHVIKFESGFVVVEEYISGSTLKSAMEDRSFSGEDVSEIAIRLCDALDILHKMTPPIIHRDINPSNIMLMADGRVKLIDFDAAKEYKATATEDTTTLGTKAYAAPEQFGSAKTDAKTDICCLGATMYHMLTCEQYIRESLIPAGKIFEIIQKCLEFDPANRYPDAEALRKDLVKLKKPAVNYRKIAIAASVLCVFAVATAFIALLPSANVGYGESQSEVTHIDLTASGLMQAFVQAGLPLADITEHTYETDPNNLLGRPGEYVEKINFNDNRYPHFADPDLTVEVFLNRTDMERRRDRVQAILEVMPIFSNQYMFYSDTMLLRIPFRLTPESANEYEMVFNAFVNNEPIPIIQAAGTVPLQEESDLDIGEYEDYLMDEPEPLDVAQVPEIGF